MGKRSKKQKTKTYPAKKKGTSMTTPKTESKVPATPQELPSETLGNTRRWARILHGNQKDKQGRPYVEHLDAVADNLYRLVGWDVELLQSAYLHDVIEDVASCTANSLRSAGYSERVVDTVYAVTKYSGEPNYDYITFVIDSGTDAMLVKLADLYNNADPERLGKVTPQTTQDRLRRKYLPAKWRIERALIAHGFNLTPTVTFEEALEACRTTPVAQTWRESTAPSMAYIGDHMKFNEDDSDRASLTIKSKVLKGSVYVFSFEDTDIKIELKAGDRFWLKWRGTSTTAGTLTWVPEWVKLMGLPKDWKDGDDLPDPLDMFQYTTVTKTKKSTPPPPPKVTTPAKSTAPKQTTKTVSAAPDQWNTGGKDVDRKTAPPPAKPGTTLVTTANAKDKTGKTFDQLLAEVDSGEVQQEAETGE